MTNVAIYSALYGSYEPVKPLPVDLTCPAYMFTDDPFLDAPGWIVRHIPKPVTVPEFDTPMLQAKWWKTHPTAALGYSYDVALWIDASVTLAGADFPQLCVDALGDDDWAMVPHPSRKCIYDEATYSATLPRYSGAKLADQAEFYRTVIGHPAGWGLFANGVSARRINAATVRLSADWWWENATRTWQDQVSLPVLVRLSGDSLKWNRNIPWGQWWSAASH